MATTDRGDSTDSGRLPESWPCRQKDALARAGRASSSDSLAEVVARRPGSRRLAARGLRLNLKGRLLAALWRGKLAATSSNRDTAGNGSAPRQRGQTQCRQTVSARTFCRCADSQPNACIQARAGTQPHAGTPAQWRGFADYPQSSRPKTPEKREYAGRLTPASFPPHPNGPPCRFRNSRC